MPAQSKAFRFSMFGLLYFTQGTILGYFAALNALYLMSRGLDIQAVGIFSSIALIPFMIKILFGMLSDRSNFFGFGHRKPYILIGLLVQFICLLFVANVDPGKSYWGFVALAFLLQMGMAFYDTCTDGLALDTTAEHEKGMLQGFMVGGRAVGVIISSLVVGYIAEKSWPMVFYFLAVLTLLPIPLLYFMREPERHADERFNWGAFKAFKNSAVLAAGGAGLVIFLVIVGANQLVNPALTAKFHIDLRTAGRMTTIWGIGCVVGALAGGRVLDRMGDKASVLATIFSVAISMILLAAVPSMPLAYVIVVLFGVAYGAGQAIYFALAMKYTLPSIAASMYAILMAVTNVGQGIGLGIGGMLTKNLGYPTTFLAFGALIFAVLAFMPAMFRRRVE